MSKILVVGAGMSGSTIARELAEAGYIVDVIDERPHIAGNCFDYEYSDTIRIHKYGPHIFHTNNDKIVSWLSKFTDWVEYTHKVKAMLSDGRYVTLPVNKETSKIVGKDNIIDTFIRPYTKKMWGMDIEELDPSILNRVPIRDDDNELYFPSDKYQFMPAYGYTKMFENILNHDNISVHLNTSFNKSMEDKYDHVFNSMAIDEYYDVIYGPLAYRSIKFHHIYIPAPKLLPTACVNFTHDGPYTRMTEWKNFPNHGESPSSTVITYEEPCDYKDNNFERYYPVKDVNGLNRETYKKYASIKNEKVTFIGRCGMYVYIDMDQACASALATAKRFIGKHS